MCSFPTRFLLVGIPTKKSGTLLPTIGMDTPQQDSFVFKDLFGPEHRYSLITAFLLLGGAYVAEHFANLYELEYSLRPTSTYVGDLLLDNLPVVNLNLIIIEGALFSIVVGVLFVLSKPRYILFSLKALAGLPT